MTVIIIITAVVFITAVLFIMFYTDDATAPPSYPI